MEQYLDLGSEVEAVVKTALIGLEITTQETWEGDPFVLGGTHRITLADIEDDHIYICIAPDTLDEGEAAKLRDWLDLPAVVTATNGEYRLVAALQNGVHHLKNGEDCWLILYQVRFE